MKKCYVCKLDFEKLLPNRKCSACMKKYKQDRYLRDKEEILRKNNEYKAVHRDQSHATNLVYRMNNKEREALRKANWTKANPLRRSETEGRRRARKLGTMTEKITVEMFRARLAEHGGVCAYCGNPPEHWDHMTPLSRGGSHTLANLAPTCGPCNLSKGSSSYEDWLSRIGVLL